MSSDQFPEQGELVTDPSRAAALPRAAAGPGEPAEGGDPACWACLVCEECGAVVSEGHRSGCSESS